MTIRRNVIQPDFVPLECRRGGYTISEYWKNIPELPDVSSCLVERRQPPATLHGVVFDILAAPACGGEFLHRHPQLWLPRQGDRRGRLGFNYPLLRTTTCSIVAGASSKLLISLVSDDNCVHAPDDA